MKSLSAITHMNMEIQAALNLPDETDAFLQISDIVFDRFSENGFDQLSDQERTFFCIDTLMRTLTNGGITQFLYETGTKQFTSTVEALKTVRANRAASLLESLAQHIGESLPEDADVRSEFVDQLEISEELSTLEEKLYALEGDLMKLSLQFVGKHLRAFH
jgi:hypothetical protein